MPPRLGLALVFAFAAGCGTGLYDAAGVPSGEGPPGLTCDGGQIACGGVCTVESATQCGSACADCTAAVLPAGAAAACIAGACDYTCLDGLLKCDGGCCGATSLAAGGATTCARLDDGTVRCWGANGSGQVGDGSLVDRPAPTRVPLPALATAVSTGERHACAVLAGGAVACWGANDSGQVTGSATPAPVLVPAATPITSGAVALAGGGGHTCALVGGPPGAVKCWGANGSGQLGGTPTGGVATPVASGATAIAAGTDHACALAGGAVKCWGANASGQLGDGTTTTPATGTLATPIASGITLLAASATLSCASLGTSPGGSVDPVLRCWGAGLASAFLGASPQPTPTIPMKDGSQSTVRFSLDGLCVGRAHACVQRQGEFVSCFGANDRGQLGAAGVPAGSTEAWAVAGNLASVALATGADHACAVLAGGRLRCWGANDRGQLGDGALADPGAGAVAIPVGR